MSSEINSHTRRQFPVVTGFIVRLGSIGAPVTPSFAIHWIYCSKTTGSHVQTVLFTGLERLISDPLFAYTVRVLDWSQV